MENRKISNDFKEINWYGVDDVINLKEFLKAIKRNKNIAISLTSITFFFSLFLAFLQKPTWQGDFQIVLDKSKSGKGQNFLGSSSQLLNLYLDNNGTNELKTEVEILKSPSVLMPVFEYSKELKKNKGYKNIESSTYSSWITRNLSIQLQKGTQVLNLSYRDNDKEFIIPILEKISKKYQQYSNKARNESISRGLEYLKNQVSIYKIKSKNSYKNLNRFELENDLKKVIPLATNIKSNGESSLASTDINQSIINARNKIKLIDSQISQIKENFESESLGLYFVNNDELKISEKILDLDKLIAINKKNYMPNNLQLKLLQRERRELLKIAKTYAINYLNSEKVKALSIIEVSTRPKGVLLKHKELIREALRDEEFLNNLEAQYSIKILEKEQSNLPWQLITNPTLLNTPVAPNKKLILLLGTSFGAFLSILYIVIKDWKEDLIYDSKEILNKFRGNNILEINKENIETIDKEFEFVFTGPFRQIKTKTISLLLNSQISEDILSKISKNFEMNIPKAQLKISDNIAEIANSDIKIIIFELGKLTKDSLSEIQRKLSLQPKSEIFSIIISQ